MPSIENRLQYSCVEHMGSFQCHSEFNPTYPPLVLSRLWRPTPRCPACCSMSLALTTSSLTTASLQPSHALSRRLREPRAATQAGREALRVATWGWSKQRRP